MPSNTMKKPAGTQPAAEENFEGIDRLFGRDLRSAGWVVDPAAGAQDRMNELRTSFGENRPDPAMIWALRCRRR
jgi:hypothetical protein